MGIRFRKLINEKCKDCIYDPLSRLGNWKQQVEGCTSKNCALWPVRPVPRRRKVNPLPPLGAKRMTPERTVSDGRFKPKLP